MKKSIVLFLTALLVLTSCAPRLGEKEEVLQNDEDSRVETSIVPGSRLEDNMYRMILPYKTSEARGLIVNQVANRVDIDEMEEGLRRHSTEVFDPEKLYFQEGNYLTKEIVFGWIDEFNPDRKDDWDRKTHEENPRIFSHVLEQNYFSREKEGNTVNLAGVSIGIALKSVYRFQAPAYGDDYTYDIPMNEMLEKGYEVAENVVQNMREMEGFPDVPILVALYREESHASPVPGNYVAKTVVPSGKNTIGKWETIDEEYVLFPSDEARRNHPEDFEIFSSFGDEIAAFFPNYIGTVGEGFYVGGELRQLKIEIPIEFYGKAEVIGFSQYVHGLVQETFKNHFDLEINVTSSNHMESLIYRNAGEENPTVHIFK